MKKWLCLLICCMGLLNNIAVAETSDGIKAEIQTMQKVFHDEVNFVFVNTEMGNEKDVHVFSLSQLIQYMSFDDMPYCLQRFAVVDMDDDDVDEIVVECGFGMERTNDVIVFHYDDDNQVYAYYFYFRGMKSIKQDGSFMYSGGASNSGYSKLFMEKQNCEYLRYTYCEDLYGESVSYYTEGKKTDFLTFSEASKCEDYKKEVVWNDYCIENIENMYNL